MPKFDPRALLKDAKARKGLASPAILGGLRTGAVVEVTDSSITWPESRLPGAGPRTGHPRRRAIVVQRQEWIRAADPPTLLVVPCSASHSGLVLGCDLEIPDDEPHFTKERVVAYVSLIQPVLKSDVVRVLGDLNDPTRTAFLTKLAAIVDLG